MQMDSSMRNYKRVREEFKKDVKEQMQNLGVPERAPRTATEKATDYTGPPPGRCCGHGRQIWYTDGRTD